MPNAEGAGTRRLGQRFVEDPRCMTSVAQGLSGSITQRAKQISEFPSLVSLERFDEVATPALQLRNSLSKLEPLKTRYLHIYTK